MVKEAVTQCSHAKLGQGRIHLQNENWVNHVDSPSNLFQLEFFTERPNPNHLGHASHPMSHSKPKP
jgi:hypothetical protein